MSDTACRPTNRPHATRLKPRTLTVHASHRRCAVSNCAQPVLIEQVMSTQTFVFLAAFNAAFDGLDQLAEAICTHFQQHPDCAVITSFPAWPRSPEPASLPKSATTAPLRRRPGTQVYAGSARITRASGASHVITTAGSKTTASPLRLSVHGHDQRTRSPSPLPAPQNPTAPRDAPV